MNTKKKKKQKTGIVLFHLVELVPSEITKLFTYGLALCLSIAFEMVASIDWKDFRSFE